MMIPLLQAEVKMISTLLEAVKKLFWLTMDVAMYAAVELSIPSPDMTKMSTQLDAAKQDEMPLVDVV